MIKIVSIGMNHESASLELRECMAKDPGNTDRALSSMRESEFIREGLFLSTCNRVEALFITEDPENAKRSVISMMSRLGEIPEDSFTSSLYDFKDMDAVRHIFRVASSLDSMVVGEPQILGQIKDAYHQAAVEQKTSGVILNRLMHKAFHVAKRVKTETSVSEAAVSISYAAVELAKKIFYDLSGRKILLIGAGEMAELAARHLMTNGVDTLVVTNRNFERAVQVAGTFKGKPVFFEEIVSYLVDVDIVITSTASSEYVITQDQAKNSMKKRRGRPLFFIDIAVPRDVEPSVNDLGNAYLYDIDDLKGVIETNTEQRKQEAVKAERIVTEEVIKFEKWMKTLEVVPTIISLKEKVETIRKAEIARSISGLNGLTPSQIKNIEKLTASLTDKIINDPILALKRIAQRSSRDTYLGMTRKLFNLDKDNNGEN
ncbi:MAG: glutamyl-tRNA reductase [Deltaproteobacteria bacterium]|nr:glutamyl-tRNA reductase [Deltaproteobacteria bacterium]